MIVFFTFLRDNAPSRDDCRVARARAAGCSAASEPPSHRFNAGEKIVFWRGVLILGGVVVGSGLVIDKLIPGLAYSRDDMQVAQHRPRRSPRC